MIGKLIVTHGGTARELLAAARMISGELSGFAALSLDWQESFEESRGKVRAALDLLDQGQGVIILTDMFGSTPCNVVLTFQQPGRVEVLTGVNLPMVLRLACRAEEEPSLAEMAHFIQAKGQKSICLVSEMLGAKVSAAPCALTPSRIAPPEKR